jgi:hypothetical protein
MRGLLKMEECKRLHIGIALLGEPGGNRSFADGGLPYTSSIDDQVR